MKIEISLDTKDAADLAALMALVGSLGAPRSAASAYPNSATITTPDGNSFTVGAGPAQVLPDVSAFPDDDGGPDDTNPELGSLPNPEGAPDVDSRGLPWDERIHASTKATNGDGSWRNKRGVDKALLEAVEAELAGGVSVPPSPTDAPVATASGAADVGGASEGNATGPTATNDAGTGAATTDGISTSTVPAAGEIPLPPAPAAEEAAGTIPDAPAAPTPADAPTFKDAMAIVTTRQREGTLTQVQVSEAAQALGLSSVVDLAKPANAEHIAAFIALLG